MTKQNNIFSSRNVSIVGYWHRGFSMIEVLVTMLIISLALLGTMGLQTYALRTNQGGQFRSQAVFLVADMAERLEGNKLEAVTNSNYVVATTNKIKTSTVDCTTVCTQDQLAEWDLFRWTTTVSNTLPQSEWSVTKVDAADGKSSVYTVKVSWVDREESATYGSGAARGASGNGLKMSYTATRNIFNPL